MGLSTQWFNLRIKNAITPVISRLFPSLISSEICYENKHGRLYPLFHLPPFPIHMLILLFNNFFELFLESLGHRNLVIRALWHSDFLSLQEKKIFARKWISFKFCVNHNKFRNLLHTVFNTQSQFVSQHMKNAMNFFFRKR